MTISMHLHKVYELPMAHGREEVRKFRMVGWMDDAAIESFIPILEFFLGFFRFNEV